MKEKVGRKSDTRYWLHDKISPILRAKGVVSPFEISELIQQIAEDELYDLWILWMDEMGATWDSKDKKSFIVWLTETGAGLKMKPKGKGKERTIKIKEIIDWIHEESETDDDYYAELLEFIHPVDEFCGSKNCRVCEAWEKINQ